ncbi:MAG: hypothetical protein WBA74_20000 [Cyclobacteriaceae bacterium]
MKERLIIISDLWGIEKSEWLPTYTQILEKRFSLKYYDSCVLGGVDKSNYNQDYLHGQFINGGIERAADNLLTKERDKANILAFSIGGSIAWNFGLKSNRINSLVCISSTRLRKETTRPTGKIALYFGENDDYKPNMEWLIKMNLQYEILTDKGHQIYCEKHFAEALCEKLIKTTPQS